MKNILPVIALSCFSLFANDSFAQTVTLNLGEQPKGSASLVNVTYNDITFQYVMGSKVYGAYIYNQGYSNYQLRISSKNKNIVRIEFEGETNDKRTSDVTETLAQGTLVINETGTSEWTGSAMNLKFDGASKSTGYTVKTLRVWLEGDEGNTGGGDVDVLQRPGSDVHYYSQGHNLPYDGKPVTLAVVSDSKFRETLQPYLLWKTQQGYNVEELYADEISKETGTTEDALALKIREKLMELDPQPSYVLLAGDCEEVPYFQPRTAMAGGHDAVTDFFYGEYTGDHFPEAAVGRFSANNPDDLKVQLDKTKHMAFINPADADWMHKSLIVHGPASDISTQKGADFGMDFGKKWKNNDTKMVYYASSVINEINEGCSLVAYLGHGWMTYWDGPKFYTWNARNLENKNMYPVVLGLTCLSGSFQERECLGEAFMRNPNGGAVAYIGATRESWDGADNLFFMGGHSSHSTFEHIGFMRSLFHPDEEDASQLTRTIGDAFNIGKFASRQIGEYQPFRQFVEFFTLFGDPTYQPYITTPIQMTISAPTSVAAGRCIEVITAPDAVVAVSRGRKVIAVGLADGEGRLSLKVPADAPTGSCTLYSSAPFYNDLASTIDILPNDGDEDPGYIADRAPRVQYKDIIDVNSASSALPGYTKEYLGYQPPSFAVGSPAQYTMWAGTNLTAGPNPTQYQHWLTSPDDVIRGIYLRNQYKYSSFITTKTAGKAAYVEVDWLHPTGQTEILGIYGSKEPYNSTEQAWNGNLGEKLGEIRKGNGNRLDITGEWPYILVRVEDYEGFFGKATEDRDDVFLRSLTIGWNRLEDGDVDADGDVDLKDVETLRYILANDQATTNADVNGDGRITIADITALVSKLLQK